MADRVSFGLYDAAGAPLAGAAPTFAQYRDRLGNARTAPALLELGGGQYGFTPTDADEATGVTFLIDAGASSTPRRYSGAVHTPAAPFIAWHLEDGAGALWTGAPPSVAQWRNFAGGARVPPSVIAIGGLGHLFAIFPSTEDLAVDVAFRLDSPPGAEPPFLSGSLEAQPWAAPSPGPLKDPAYDIVQFLDGKTAGTVALAQAVNLFIGQHRSTDRTPSPAVFALNTGGPTPQTYLGGHRTALYRPTVQVMVRGPAGDDATGEALARGVMAWLQQQVTAGYITWSVRESAPAFLGSDTGQHGQWVMNIECLYRASLA
jgi:hypothetical protein